MKWRERESKDLAAHDFKGGQRRNELHVEAREARCFTAYCSLGRWAKAPKIRACSPREGVPLKQYDVREIRYFYSVEVRRDTTHLLGVLCITGGQTPKGCSNLVPGGPGLI